MGLRSILIFEQPISPRSKFKQHCTRANINGLYFGRVFSHVADTHLIHYSAPRSILSIGTTDTSA